MVKIGKKLSKKKGVMPSPLRKTIPHGTDIKKERARVIKNCRWGQHRLFGHGWEDQETSLNGGDEGRTPTGLIAKGRGVKDVGNVTSV